MYDKMVAEVGLGTYINWDQVAWWAPYNRGYVRTLISAERKRAPERVHRLYGSEACHTVLATTLGTFLLLPLTTEQVMARVAGVGTLAERFKSEIAPVRKGQPVRKMPQLRKGAS